jgi:DAPG hydrolase PhiG domain
MSRREVAGSDPLESYLHRPMSAPDAQTLGAIESGPLDQRQALALDEVERLTDPAGLAGETGWCTLPDGVGYVAVRTAMPGVSAEMIDWWFDWHPREAVRYRLWHPLAHRDNTVQAAAEAGAKAHWGTVHHPVEDVGVGMVRARIEFLAPSRMGMKNDHLDDPGVATIVCGYAGDDTRRMRHTPMFHVFLSEPDGVVLRSRFWLGAALRPYGPLGAVGERLLNHRAVRSRALPAKAPEALARHCAEEYANLGALLGELYGRFGPQAA